MFVSGGIRGRDNTITSDCHIYYVDANEWIQGPNLLKERRDPNSCILGQKLYIFGGVDASNAGL